MWKHGMLCEQKGLEFKHLELEFPSVWEVWLKVGLG